MVRVFLIALAVGVLLLAIAFLAIGVFPPKPHVHTVEHALPTSSLGTK